MARQPKTPDGIRKRGKTYYADFRANGRRIVKALSTDLRTATELLNELRSRAQKAEYGILDNRYPIDRLRAEYLAHCRQTMKGSSADRAERALRAVLDRLKVVHVAGLTVPMLVDYRNGELRAGKSPGTINIQAGHLSTMLRWGVRNKLIGSNPLEGLRRLQHDRPKEGRALTHDEVRRLLNGSGPLWRDVWYTYLVTGMRKSELSNLLFRDVDMQAREITVRADVAKSHRERRIPIEDGLYEILERKLAERDSRRPSDWRDSGNGRKVRARFTRDHVFVSHVCTPLDNARALYTSFIRCCRKAGIEIRRTDADGREIDHVDIHSLRRTFATDLIESGADPKSVQMLLGHAKLEMTMRLYTKLRAGTTRQAIGRLSYGQGATPGDHAVEFPIPGRSGYNLVTSTPKAERGIA